MFDMKVEATGVEATWRLINRAKHLLPRIVQRVAEIAADEARPITHIFTGALQRSHQAYRINSMSWKVTPDPTVINIFGYRPAKYGPVEHKRGGSHAFYDRTILERTRSMVNMANAYVEVELGG